MDLFFPSVGILLVVCIVVMFRRLAERRRRLLHYYDAEELQDEPDDDTVDYGAAPYCIACDTPNSPGSYFCERCGQKIG